MKKLLKVFTLLLLTILLIGCSENTTKKDTTTLINTTTLKSSTSTVINTDYHSVHTSYNIMVGTTLETTVHVFESEIKGPTVFIVGGTHGDEFAGWNAALLLVDRANFRGKVIIIPRLNKLGCDLRQRYPGISNSGMYEGTKYQDLNRSFPGVANGNITERLAYAIQLEVEKYDPDYIVDLHESRSASTEGNKYVGNSLLYSTGDSHLLCDDIIEIFNANCLEEGDRPFISDGPGTPGSFNDYFGSTLGYPEFTIETNRELDLEKRIMQQVHILDILFDYIMEN